MTKVIVTGAAGFIGRPLCLRLKGAGYEPVEVTRAWGDVEQPETWARLPAAAAVIHLAARTSVPESWRDPSAYLRANLNATLAGLDYCRAQRARMIFLSSYLYGNCRTQPISEDTPLAANNPYGLSKLMAEQACHFYATSLNVPVAVLRPFNVYGPGQPDHFLVPHILQQIRARGEIRIKDLRPKRDYVHVADVVEAIVKCMMLSQHYAIFNVGTGKSFSVETLIELAQRAAGTRLPVISSAEVRENEIMDCTADVSRAAELLDWRPRWDLERGLASLLGEPAN